MDGERVDCITHTSEERASRLLSSGSATIDLFGWALIQCSPIDYYKTTGGSVADAGWVQACTRSFLDLSTFPLQLQASRGKSLV